MNDVQSDYRYGDYAGLVHQLMGLGDRGSYRPETWPDYQAEFGIGHQHVDMLLRLACDEALLHGGEESDAGWAPMHAWRALGQLRAEASVEPLLAVLQASEDNLDETANLEIPAVFGLIGRPAIAPIAAFVSNVANTTWPVAAAIDGLRKIFELQPDCRDECIGALVRLLQPGFDTDPSISGFAISGLIDLRAVEAIDAIRAAFQRDAVDVSIAGDLEDVEIDLGLREHRITPKPNYVAWPAEDSVHLDDDDSELELLPVRSEPKVGRNAPCPCGSGKKYKKCCLNK